MTDEGAIENIGKSRWKGDAARFVGAGALNTLLTLGVYQGLLFFCGPAWAYAIAWGCGLLFVATFYPRKVFKAGGGRMLAGVAVAVVYLLGFLLGLSVVAIIAREFSAPRLAIFVSIGVTTVFNFIVMRAVLARIEHKAYDA